MINDNLKPRIILFNKPFQVLCQFSEHEGKETLAAHIAIPDIYPAGRLDFDSEGLLILTDNGQLQSLITHPDHKLDKTYWAQLEGDISEQAIDALRSGVNLNDGTTLPATVSKISAPVVWERHPPIRQRANKPTSWIELTIREGKNRQVRRMTAAVGHPTLRLIRKSIGAWTLSELAPGEWTDAPLTGELAAKLASAPKKAKHKKTHVANTKYHKSNKERNAGKPQRHKQKKNPKTK
ncbi:MAG: pseudouridine synthase [Moraxellaceae bacterium]|nr:MAG: pseudouridine synthase [Moraxellaceae bacterium]